MQKKMCERDGVSSARKFPTKKAKAREEGNSPAPNSNTSRSKNTKTMQQYVQKNGIVSQSWMIKNLAPTCCNNSVSSCYHKEVENPTTVAVSGLKFHSSGQKILASPGPRVANSQ